MRAMVAGSFCEVAPPVYPSQIIGGEEDGLPIVIVKFTTHVAFLTIAAANELAGRLCEVLDEIDPQPEATGEEGTEEPSDGP